jgi:hypothetical protein
MCPVPFGLDDVTRLAAATAAPLVPLLLTIFSPEELLMRIIKVLFRGSAFVEMINLRVRRVTAPVHLHEPYA